MFGLDFTELGYGPIRATLLTWTGNLESQIMLRDRNIVHMCGCYMEANRMISHVTACFPLPATVVNDMTSQYIYM